MGEDGNRSGKILKVMDCFYCGVGNLVYRWRFFSFSEERDDADDVALLHGRWWLKHFGSRWPGVCTEVAG